MRRGEPTIRLARPNEAGDIASLYAICMPTSVWGKLGEAGELYFRHFCVGPDEVAVTASLDGRLVGACLGTGRPDVYMRRFYIENARALAAALVREAVHRPSVLVVLARRVAWGMARRLGAALASARGNARRTERLRPDLPLDAPGMSYIAHAFVWPSYGGRGLGAMIVRRSVQEMAERGFESCRANISVDNIAAQTVARRAGFECVARREDNLTFVRRIDSATR